MQFVTVSANIQESVPEPSLKMDLGTVGEPFNATFNVRTKGVSEPFRDRFSTARRSTQVRSPGEAYRTAVGIRFIMVQRPLLR